MGSFCNSPKPPPAPDPTVVANAQAGANIASATAQQKLNMIGTSGPYGSTSYKADETQPGGYTQTTTLSPDQQHILEAGSHAQIGALGVANDQLGRVSTALNRGLDPSGVQTSFDHGGALRSGYDQGGQVQTSYGAGGPVQSGYDMGGDIRSRFNQGQPLQGDVGPQNLYGAYQSAADASYGQAASRLDPQFAQQKELLEGQLAAQGLGINSTAYQNAQDTFNRGKNDAYNQANYSSQAAGLNAENTIFGQGVQQGQFHNAAANQGYQQNLGAAQFANSAQSQYNQEHAAAAQFANTAQAQTNQQNLAAAAFHNTGQAQENQQNQAAAAFHNSTAGQQYAQNQGAAQFGNQATNQQFQQNAYAQNLPINEFNALMSSGQVGQPQGINYTPSQVDSTNVLGAYQLNANVNNQNYQAQMAQQSAMLGGLSQLGGAAITRYSDIRLKRDIELIGREADGLGVYRYRYIWDDEPHIGVMAQEAQGLRPHAVVTMPDGFLGIDYGAL